MQNKHNFKQVAAEALSSIERILSSYLPGGKQKGNEYIVTNPTRQDNKAGSFSINTETGVWSDFSTGDRGGDIISLLAYIRGCSQLAAYQELCDLLAIEVKPAGQRDSPQPRKEKPEWIPILPIPDEALKSRPQEHYRAGKPSFIWSYKDADNRLLMQVMRFDITKNGESQKDYRPLIYAKESATGRKNWRWQQPKKNRPLYALNELAARPDDPVLLVEGEKAADAAKQLLPTYICMTWPGGSKALSKVDLAPLAGRSVLLWPDNDEAGKKAMQKLAGLLNKNRVEQVQNIDLAIFNLSPKGTEENPAFTNGAEWPAKADAADAQLMGWKAAHFSDMEKQGRLTLGAESKQKKPEEDKPSRFIVRDEGVYYRLPNDDPNDDSPPVLFRVCDKLEILGRTRDKNGTNWGMLVAFTDPDGTAREWNIPAEALATEGGAEILRGLFSRGLSAESGQKPRRRLLEYIQSTGTQERITLVNKLGWFGRAFLLPSEVVGSPKERLYFHDSGVGSSKIEEQGTLKEWKENVSLKCIDNHRPIFAICTAFAAPLLELTGSETAGFHFYGSSSHGKTTLLRLAASVYGSPDYVKTWRSTDNALEATAASHSDCLLVLDEIGQCDARIIGESIYMLGNGKGKARANDRGGSKNNLAEWRLLFLSTGEKALSDHLAEVGKVVKAGMDMRLLAIPSDAGKELGVFDTVHDFNGGAALSSYLLDKTSHYYGAPFKAYIERLVSGHLISTLPERIKSAKLEFTQDNLSTLASGQDNRAADKFALVGLAGELATHFGLTGWPQGAAKTAAQACFRSWLDQRGGEGNLEDRQIIQQVSLFFERYGESRFTRWDSEGARVDEHVPRTDNRCGFRKTETQLRHGRDESTETAYYVLPESFRAEICKSQSPRYVAKLLHSFGALESTADGKHSKPYRLPGYGKKLQRCYKIIPACLNADRSEGAQTDE